MIHNACCNIPHVVLIVAIPCSKRYFIGAKVEFMYEFPHFLRRQDV